MKLIIDVKSAVLGIGVGILVMFTLGAGTSTNPVGKYQLTGIGNGTGGWSAVVVDTQTGEAWGADFSRDWGGSKNSQFWGVKNN